MTNRCTFALTTPYVSEIWRRVFPKIHEFGGVRKDFGRTHGCEQ